MFTTGENLIAPVASDKKTTNQVMELFRRSLTYNVRRRQGYVENERMFLLGEQLEEQDYGDHRVEIKFATRFCRTHSSYVMKDKPNIAVPPRNPNLTQFLYQASRNEMALNSWWDDNDIVKKLKR